MKNNIGIARLNAGLTQKQAAEKLGISLSTMSKWEQGVYDPSTEAYIQMAKLFGCSVDTLMGGSFVDPEELGIVATTYRKREKPVNEEERELLHIFRCMTDEQRAAVLSIMRMIG